MAANVVIYKAPYEERKAVSTLSQKSATVAENGETTATVAEFGDSRTFLRQCGQALTDNRVRVQGVVILYKCHYCNVIKCVPRCNLAHSSNKRGYTYYL